MSDYDLVGNILGNMADFSETSEPAPNAITVCETVSSAQKDKGKSSSKARPKVSKKKQPPITEPTPSTSSASEVSSAHEDMAFLKSAIASLTQKMDTFVPIVNELKSAYDDYVIDVSATSEPDVHAPDHVTEHAPDDTQEEGQISENGPEVQFPTNLLHQLDACVKDDSGFDPDIDTKLSDAVTKLLTHGLTSSNRDAVLSKYNPPGNCKRLDVVRVNPEIFNTLKRDVKTEDVMLQKVQRSLVTGTSAVIRLLDSLVKAGRGEQKPPETAELIAGLTDAVCLLSDTSHALDLRRRSAFKAEMKEEFKSLCSDAAPVTNFLFGDELSTTVKSVIETNKVSRQLAVHRSRGDPSSYQHRQAPYRRPPF